MPEKKYFLKLGGSFLLGAFVIIISVLIACFSYPYLAPFFGSLFMGLAPYLQAIFTGIIIFIVVLVFVYLATFLGVLLQYVFKPMHVSREKKDYTIAETTEAGLRQKGKTKPQVKKKKEKKND